MNYAIRLLGELFLIGCLHMLMNIIIDKDKMADFSKISAIACTIISLFLIARFAMNYLLPQMSGIFRMVW